MNNQSTQEPLSDDSDKSSSEDSHYSSSLTSSLSGSSTSDEKEERSDDESFYSFGNEYDIVKKFNLNRFVQKFDKNALLDDQAANLVTKMADAFVKDVAMRVAKLAKYRKDVPTMLDVEFTLKREYNMEFPNNYQN